MTEPPIASEPDACIRLYRNERPRLLAYARALTGNLWLAEDLVAEAHFRVWRWLRVGTVTDSLPGYLMTAVWHLASDRAEDPPLRFSSVDLLVQSLDGMPRHLVEALWRTEMEYRPTAAAGAPTAGDEDTADTLPEHAREELRQAYLGGLPGAPPTPACRTHWNRLPAHARGLDGPREAERIALHTDHCPHCRARLAAMVRADEKLPGLLGPALLALLAEGSAPHLMPLTGIGMRAPGGALPPAAASAAPAGGPPRVVGRPTGARVRQAGPAMAVLAGAGVLAVAGAAVATGLALTGGDTAQAERRTDPPAHTADLPPNRSGGASGLPGTGTSRPSATKSPSSADPSQGNRPASDTPQGRSPSDVPSGVLRRPSSASAPTWSPVPPTIAAPTARPSTDPPTTQPPSTQPPTTEPPSTEPPTTQPPSTDSPTPTPTPTTQSPTPTATGGSTASPGDDTTTPSPTPTDG